VYGGCSRKVQRIPLSSATEQAVQLDRFRAVLQASEILYRIIIDFTVDLSRLFWIVYFGLCIYTRINKYNWFGILVIRL